MSQEIELAKSIFKTAEFLLQTLRKIPKTKILNQEAVINVPESVVDYTLCAEIPNSFRTIRKPIQINAPSIIRASVSCLSPLPQSCRNAITRVTLQDGNVAFMLFPEMLPKDAEMISVSASYKIPDTDLIDDLVERTAAHEPSGKNQDEYWIHASLKHPKVLTERFGRFDIRDVGVTVDVAVHNELKLAIPQSFISRLKIFFDIMSQTDPRQQYKAIPRLRTLTKYRTAGKEFDLIRDVQALFLPTEFSKYIDVLKDFRYSNCYAGKECYDLPIEVIPKKMEVISRTDVDLDNLARDGWVLYKKDLLREAIETLFKTT